MHAPLAQSALKAQAAQMLHHRMNNPTPEEIGAALPAAVRQFVHVTCNIKPHAGFGQLCRAIGEAFQRFQAVPARWRMIDLILTDDPPQFWTPVGLFTFAPLQGILAMTDGNIILMRASQLLAANYDVQICAVLEELTHALLNLKDENLVTWVVSFLYSYRIAYHEGRYVPADSFQPHWPPKPKDWSALYAAKSLDLDALKKAKPSRRRPRRPT